MKRNIGAFLIVCALLFMLPKQDAFANTVVGVIMLGETVEITVPAKEQYIYVFTPEEDVECVFYCDPAGCMEATISAVTPSGPNAGVGRASQFVQAGVEADLYIYNYTDIPQTYILHLDTAAPAEVVMEQAVTKQIGDRFRLDFTLSPENARNEGWVSWVSDNQNVVTIENRDIICVGEGTANVTVTLEGGGKGTCKVTVTDPDNFVMYLEGAPETAWVNGNYTLQVIAPQEVLDEGIDWVIKGDDVVEYFTEYDTLTMFPFAPGTVTVYAVAPNSDISASATIKVEHRYNVIEGQNLVVSSGKTLTVRSDGDYSEFVGVLVDEQWVDASNYTAKKGSTIVTLHKEYLAGLERGSHEMTLLFQDSQGMNGTANAVFTITEKDEAEQKATDPAPTKPQQTETKPQEQTTPTKAEPKQPAPTAPKVTEPPATAPEVTEPPVTEFPATESEKTEPSSPKETEASTAEPMSTQGETQPQQSESDNTAGTVAEPTEPSEHTPKQKKDIPWVTIMLCGVVVFAGGGGAAWYFLIKKRKA